jgi:hypothetical protein
MVNNYTNINKTIERLNSDGQQLHQYNWVILGYTGYTGLYWLYWVILGYTGLYWLYWVILGYTGYWDPNRPHLDNWMSNRNKDINKQ